MGGNVKVVIMYFAYSHIVEVVLEVGVVHEESAVIWVRGVLLLKSRGPAWPMVTPLASPLLTAPPPRVPNLQ